MGGEDYKPEIDFSQDTLLAGRDSLGICVRVSFKWLALMLYDAPFKYDHINVDKSAAKQDAYSDQAIALLRDVNFDGLDPINVHRYVSNDINEMSRKINEWGTRFKSGDKIIYNNVQCEGNYLGSVKKYFQDFPGARWSEFAGIINIYFQMTESAIAEIAPRYFIASSPRMMVVGHAVAVCGVRDKLFDANYGVFAIDGATALEKAHYVDKYLDEKYKNPVIVRRTIIHVGIRKMLKG